MKKKKNIILELIILLTIIASIITIIYAYYQANDIAPKESESNMIINYSENRYFEIKKDLDVLNIYNIPENERIVTDNSTYNYYITATDGLITTIDERIIIEYDTYQEEPLDENKINNFCNSYDEITDNYKLICRYQNNKITISNTFYLKNIFNDYIQTKKYKIKKDVNYNDPLNNYLETLDKNNISYSEISNID